MFILIYLFLRSTYDRGLRRETAPPRLVASLSLINVGRVLEEKGRASAASDSARAATSGRHETVTGAVLDVGR